MLWFSFVLMLLGAALGVLGLSESLGGDGMAGMVNTWAVEAGVLLVLIGLVLWVVTLNRRNKLREGAPAAMSRGARRILTVVCAILGGAVSLVVLGISGGDVDDNWYIYCIPGALIGVVLAMGNGNDNGNDEC